MKNILDKIKSLLPCLNHSLLTLNEVFKEEDLDIDILMPIFEKILEKGKFIENYNIRTIYPIKSDFVTAYALRFYNYLDKNLYKKALNIILQLEEGSILRIYDIHRLNKSDFMKINEFGLPMYSRGGRNYTSTKHAYITIPCRKELRNKVQDLIIDKKYYTLYDAYTLVHEIGHSLDTDLSWPYLDIETLSNDEPEFIFNYTRCVFKEVITNFLESAFTKYLLENSDIPHEYIVQNSLLKFNDHLYRFRLSFFILNLNNIFENKKMLK